MAPWSINLRVWTYPGHSTPAVVHRWQWGRVSSHCHRLAIICKFMFQSRTNLEMPLFATLASFVRWHPRHCGLYRDLQGLALGFWGHGGSSTLRLYNTHSYFTFRKYIERRCNSRAWNLEWMMQDTCQARGLKDRWHKQPGISRSKLGLWSRFPLYILSSSTFLPPKNPIHHVADTVNSRG